MPVAGTEELLQHHISFHKVKNLRGYKREGCLWATLRCSIMVSQMTRPYEHPTKGGSYFRQRTPEHPRIPLDDTIVSRSLRTKNPADVKLRHPFSAKDQAII